MQIPSDLAAWSPSDVQAWLTDIHDDPDVSAQAYESAWAAANQAILG